MIFSRFIFITCLVLSGFYPGYNKEVKSNLSTTNNIHENTLLRQEPIISNSKVFAKNQGDTHQIQSNTQKHAHLWLIAEVDKKDIAQESNPRPEASSTDNRLWPVIGMVSISVISLFLIRILLTKPRQDQENSKDSVTLNPKNNLSEVPRLSTTTSVNQSIENQNLSLDLTNSTDLVSNKLNSSMVVDNSNHSLEEEKVTFPEQVSQGNDIVNEVDIVQKFINNLADLSHDHQPTSVQKTQISQAIWQLAMIEGYCSIEPLLKVMPQVGTLEKNLILEVISQINQRSYQQINNQLFATLKHENPEARLNALRDLNNLYQFVAPVITQISQMQADQDYEVKQAAKEILNQLNASPLPTFHNHGDSKVDNLDILIGDQESEANLHLVAYLLAELDAEK